jgi:hypothetical protein
MSTTPQLTYAVSTTPNPLQASPQKGPPSLAELTIVVSNTGHGAIDCSSISFAFLAGTGARDFFLDASGIETNVSTANWTIVQSGNVFTATPVTPAHGKITREALTFTLSNIQVNAQPGTTQMPITEITGDRSTGTLSIALAKFPPSFEVGDLDADPLSVGPGGSTVLSWSGTSEASYAIEYADVIIKHPANDPHRPLPATGSYTIDGIQADTVFNLIVTASAPRLDDPLKVVKSREVTVVGAQINNFTAFPLTLGKGDSCHIAWKTNADRCVLDPRDQQVAAPNGSTTMSFDVTTEITLTAFKGTDLKQDTRSVTVVPPVIKSFKATPTGTVNAGDQVTLEWSTQYASSVRLDPGGITVTANDRRVVTPAMTTEYTLTCSGLGADVQATLKVEVNSVEIVEFSIAPTTIDPGQSASLSWRALRSTAQTIDQGIGSVEAAGSASVNPDHDAAYTLTCEGPNGPVSQAVNLIVNSVKLEAHADYQGVAYSPNPNSYYYNLVWSTQNASRVQLYNPLSQTTIDVETNGSRIVYTRQDGTTSYVLTAWGPGQSPVSVTVDCLGVIQHD